MHLVRNGHDLDGTALLCVPIVPVPLGPIVGQLYLSLLGPCPSWAIGPLGSNAPRTALAAELA